MKSETTERQPLIPSAHFRQQLSATRRGARLARLLAVQQLADWGWARDGEAVQTAALLVAELAANAVVHGRVAGRDFLLTLAVSPTTTTLPTAPAALRIAVSDCRGERLPAPAPGSQSTDEYGRGLLIIETLATRWGTEPRPPSGKTVWAEIALGGGPMG
ncbi:ATP-binding protein [Streptomyces sp. NRRL S-1813]|uniref:ATP-binding protein n=1 Tax=Streptomyces sp. NRRL S-1813 TaxID=1463888 RepID=UPI0004C8687E|nr:ATP-binding protein [Streptomyces sp. NRRL S-1813]